MHVLSRGGKARAKVLTAEERHESARQAAGDRWARRSLDDLSTLERVPRVLTTDKEG